MSHTDLTKRFTAWEIDSRDVAKIVYLRDRIDDLKMVYENSEDVLNCVSEVCRCLDCASASLEEILDNIEL